MSCLFLSFSCGTKTRCSGVLWWGYAKAVLAFTLKATYKEERGSLFNAAEYFHKDLVTFLCIFKLDALPKSTCDVGK